MWQNMGTRYMTYRSFHEIEKRLGALEKKHPQNPSDKTFISVTEWRKIDNPFGFDKGKKHVDNPTVLKEKFEKVIQGSIPFFNKEWKHLGENYDWITNPDSNYTYEASKHWSKINDFDPKIGDIKYVWEKSRFSYLLTVMRYDDFFNEDHSQFVFNEIESWINANPINSGPNWKCSQEISLRIFNWTILLHYYKKSEYFTDELFAKIQNVIYWSLDHVFKHINFSRIAVRNNHAITETMILGLSHSLFPFIPETKLWSNKGKLWFEQEVEYQVYPDGTFLQFSMNYHRVLVQLFSLGIVIAENTGIKFKKSVFDRAYNSVNFLYQCMDNNKGELPNYGSNDGALFYPLNDADYRDYRPQLNHLHFILTGENLSGFSCEDQNWFNLNTALLNNYNAIKKSEGIISFPDGGYYLIREKNSFTFLRCGNHKDRPAHADNLHMDVWVEGENVLRDSGTYKYNTSKELSNYFTGTASHNTCQIGGHSQMLKGSRFIWYHWSQVKKVEVKENDEEYILKLQASVFRQLDKSIVHSRVIHKRKGELVWTVEDEFINAPAIDKYQNWHLNPNALLSIKALENDEIVNADEMESWYSSYYGVKEESKGLNFKFNNKIETEIKL